MYKSLTSVKRRFSFTPAQVLVLGFGVLIFAGSLLLWAPFSQEPGRSISYLDALFTATSAVCVTGLVVVDTASQFSAVGELILLALIQAGGLGIMTLSVLIFMLVGRRISLEERLMIKEALGSFSIAGVVRLSRNIILATLGIEAAGALLLTLRFLTDYPLPQAIYWGLFHAVSAFNNAGFDLTSASLRPFASDPFILFVIGILVTLGGIGFPVMNDLWRYWRRREHLSLQTRIVLRVTAGVIGLGTLLFLVLEWANPNTFGPMPWYDKVVNAWFAAVTPRTAGFESVPTGALVDASLMIMILVMFIGASPGGTGGGIKTTTFMVLGLVVHATASGADEVRLLGRRLSKDVVDRAITVAVISMALVFSMATLLLVSETAALEDPLNPLSFIDLLFEVVSAFSTVGLTTGVTPHLSPLGRVLVMITMFVGRVGPLTIATALAQRQKVRSALHYPEEKVMIG